MRDERESQYYDSQNIEAETVECSPTEPSDTENEMEQAASRQALTATPRPSVAPSIASSAAGPSHLSGASGITPTPPKHPPPNIRGKQHIRHNTGKYANRGGKNKDFFDKKYCNFKNYAIDPHMKGKALPKHVTKRKGGSKGS